MPMVSEICVGAERWNVVRMKKKMEGAALPLMRGMLWLGVLGTVATVVLRICLTPGERDWDTGLFASNRLVVVVMLSLLVLLALLAYLARADRCEISGRGATPTAVALLAAGGVLAVASGIRLIGFMQISPFATEERLLMPILQLLEVLFGLLGGVAFVQMGLTLLSEGATRQGMAQWRALAPVLWMWFRLATYEASYASTVRVSNSFFYFVMFILELLFLFRLARYVSGVGKVTAQSLLFHAMSTALFALSAPIVRLSMYLLQDSEAYQAAQQAGVTDFAVGVLALTVGVSLVHSAAHPVYAPSSDPSGSEETVSEQNAE